MRFFLYLNLFFTTFFSSNTPEQYPVLTEFVTDKALIMTSSEVASLEAKLKSYEAENTHQLVVLTIQDLNGDAIENYALQVFNYNGIGQEQADNGILILFSKIDREVRIEVGDGFQPIITDAFASRVIRNTMIPAFKDENYFEGINQGVDELIRLIDDPRYRSEFAEAIEQEGKMPLFGKVFLGLFLICFLGLFIVVGGSLFLAMYRRLIDIYKGFITGKISLLTFPFLLLGTIVSLLLSLPFIFMPLVFGYVFMLGVFLDKSPKGNPENLLSSPNLVLYLATLSVVLFVVFPLILAFRSKKPYQALKLSFTKNNKRYISQHISSSGSSFSSSSSSSSSFSGGGGSSSGGGASGSW